MQQRRYAIVDVFTDRPFGGNPLAVVLDAEGLSDAQMQALAREFNYSETSFVLPPRDPRHHAEVRIFTPGQELPFAGHPNVGTAYVLGHEAGNDALETFLFEEKAGIVPVRLLRDDAQIVVGAELTAPAALERRPGITPAVAAACLSLTPADILSGRHAPEIISVGLAFLVVELSSRDALRRATLDPAAFRAADTAGAIYLYTRDVAPAESETDIQARMFSPGDGISEDPATGSATAAAGALQAALHPDADLELSLLVGQGVDLGRPSLLRVHVSKRAGVVGRVRVGGRCVPMMRGSFGPRRECRLKQRTTTPCGR